MPFLGIEKGKEFIFERDDNRKDGIYYSFIELPKGTIKKIIGRDLRKNEEPYNLQLEDD